MNTNDAHTPGMAPPPDGEELLRELMPKLGMEAKEPGTRYKLRARIKYVLPKVLCAGVLAVLLICAGVYLSAPAAFQDIQVQETPDRATVTFRLDHMLLLESVKAELDGLPVGVTQQGAGAYRIDVERNGHLTVTSRTSFARECVTEITVSAIDEQPPHIAGDKYVDGDMFVYFTDGDGAGIDWGSVAVTEADTGAPYEVSEVSEEEGYVRFSFPDTSVRIQLEDKAGNPLAVVLDLLPADGTPA